MKTNVKRTPAPAPRTAGGAVASRINDLEKLRRSVLANMLGENQYYEDGQKTTDRIKSLIPNVDSEALHDLAIEARTVFGLRHVPLMIAREMARHPRHRPWVYRTLTSIIRRADEIPEFLAMYWAEGKQPLAKQVYLALKHSFKKFRAYHFEKYTGEGREITLRDVMFLTHPQPPRDEWKLYKQIADRELPPADTWEVELSKQDGRSKAEKWTSLLEEEKLGALAVVRNIRNMSQAGVDQELIDQAIGKMYVRNVYPFQLLNAAKVNPRHEAALEQAMLRSVEGLPRLEGRTLIVVDLSGSMGSLLSGKSETTRADTAMMIAATLREICVDPVIMATAGNDHTGIHASTFVPARRGFALRDALHASRREIGGGGIFLTQCLTWAKEREPKINHVVVITDEADCDRRLTPASAPAYGQVSNTLINIGIYDKGIAYGKFDHITGFSEATVHYLAHSINLGLSNPTQ